MISVAIPSCLVLFKSHAFLLSHVFVDTRYRQSTHCADAITIPTIKLCFACINLQRLFSVLLIFSARINNSNIVKDGIGIAETNADKNSRNSLSDINSEIRMGRS